MKYSKTALNPDYIIEYFCNYFNTTKEDIKGDDRNGNVVQARHYTAYFMYSHANISKTQIGIYLNKSVNNICVAIEKIHDNINIYKEDKETYLKALEYFNLEIMEIKGIVHQVERTVDVTDSFKKRELIIEITDNPEYPEFVKFEAIQDKVNLFDKCKTGDIVEVSFNLKGRPWTDKAGKTSYFNTLQVWKLTNLSGSNSNAPVQQEQPQIETNGNDDDDLPF